MALTKLDPNVIGTDSSGASKLTSAGGLVQLHSTGVVTIANTTANSVYISNTGLVGIGTASPNTTIHAKAPAFTDSIVTIDATSTNVSQRLNLAANGTVQTQLYDDASQTILKSVTAKPLYLGANNSNMVAIAANGYVGIGNTTPAEKLHVQTTGADNTLLRLTAETGQAGVKMYAGSGVTNRATRLDFFNGVASTSTPRWVLINDYNQDGTNDFQIVDASLNKVMVAKQGGKIGIGTATPYSSLQLSVSNMQSPSSTDILPTALLSMSGGGGDYLSIGQYTNSHFWMQGGYANPSLAKYNILMQPLGGKVGIGTTSPDEQFTSVGRRGMVQPSDSVRRCVEFHTYISASTTNTDVFAVDVGTLNHGFYYEIIVTGSDWSNHSAARVIKRGFHCPNTGYTAHSVVESSGPHAANIIYDYGLSGNVFTGKLRLDTGSVTLHCYVRLIGRIASYSVYGTE